MGWSLFLILSLFQSLLLQNHVSFAQMMMAQEEDLDEEELSANLFAPPDEIQVFAPSQFPKPTHLIQDGPPGVTVVVEPVFGHHRPDQDAIFAYAEGYGLEYYMMFVETLADTGFKGDYVLAISEPAMIKPNVMEYLQYQNRVHVVIYNNELSCLDTNGNPGAKRRNMPHGGLDIFQMCQLADVYGWKDAHNGGVRIAPDPRAHRVVATLRYEWYWIWAQQYQPNVWILLIDARDSFFQSDPFAHVPPRQSPSSKDGLLYFFGENHEATRLGKSTKNRNWLRNAYGEAVINALKDKPTICSGSTMGEQIALETYLRALVNEWDETDIGMTGADQGFHNYLYYSRKLQGAETIREIIVWEQGKGIVNNLGALRTKKLTEWGIYNPQTHEIFNWDLKTLSPVAHQWDRDEAVHTWLYRNQMQEWVREWKSGAYQKRQEQRVKAR
ncbi:expressed unknown protein [Seminavis robusta]|uniref:Uncharacterized protein n=1 Tax=Seminavis robusta TaxID=568900 RepID=A0A9N8DYE8_9STRA|nr:expressed unknown protein [Seminavis robusta]|eukprot:Sro389_g132660.1 n/a (442) ;mRNA; r:49704-51115